VITCPQCRHTEYDGTLFCSECGTRLWAFDDETASLTGNFARQSGELTADLMTNLAAPPLAGQIAIRVHGASNQIQLSGKTEYLLGRADPKQEVNPDVDLGPFNGQQLGVSRKHALLQTDPYGLTVIDLGSTNGTLVNGKIIAANSAQRLKDGDEIRLGKLALNVYFVPEKK
jgi:hypothetical protein